MRTLLATALASSAALLGGATVANAADTVVNVTTSSAPGSPGWTTGDTRSPGIGGFAAGPAMAPLGWGSYKLDTTSADNAAKVQFQTDQFRSTPLSSITGISYSTYRVSSTNGAGNASLNLVVRLSDAITFGTLVYEPYWQTGGQNAIINNQWQSWDAAAGNWWTTKVTGECDPDHPCSFARIKQLFPTARVYDAANYPSFGLNQGTYNPGTLSYADALAITVNGDTTTFNFDPADTTKPSCGSMVVRRGGGPGGADEADVTITDTGSGIASITNFVVTNGTAHVPAFTAGDSTVTVTARKTTQGVPTRFEFDVTDRAGNTTHCV